MHRTRVHASRVLLLAVALTAPAAVSLPCCLALAQESPLLTSNSDAADNTWTPPERITVSIDFRGGTVGEFIKQLKAAAAPLPINTLMTPETSSLHVAPFTAQQVGINTALTLLCRMVEGSREGVGGPLGIEQIHDTVQSSLTFALYSTYKQPTLPVLPRSTRVYALADLVQAPQEIADKPGAAVQLDTLMSAIEVALQADGAGPDNPPPDLRLHRDSLILAARGTDPQQQLIKSVLFELENSTRQRRAALTLSLNSEREARARTSALQYEVRQAQIAVRRAEDEAQEAAKARDRIEQMIKSGAAPVSEADEARRAAQAAQHNLEAAQLALKAAEDRAASGGFVHTDQPGPTAPALTERSYDLRDLGPIAGELQPLIGAILSTVPGSRAEPGSGTIRITAPGAQHQALELLFGTLRRLRANDPGAAQPRGGDRAPPPSPK